ncbi:MAG TPA: energy-coupling factor transporter ATPase [Firmicutes bacterium]|jgi:energy-coupling factor transport system ATP-binding protein|nr:energy-coupling factor transporter ATPase [Bacillota bacterium]
MPIEVENLSYTYMPESTQSVAALQGINLRIADGEFVGIMGRTGSGKSTLIQLLAGLLTPTRGRVLLDGRDIAAKDYDRSILRRTVGIVFQYPEYQLFETTVAKDVAFGLKHSGLNHVEVTSRVRKALEIMGFDYDKIHNQSPLALSGGEKRRVAIAGVLAVQPKILIFDEPVAGLDPQGRYSFMQLTARLHQGGTTIIMVSHNTDVLSEYTERLVVLEHGQIALEGLTKDVFMQLPTHDHLPVAMSTAQEIAYMLAARGMNLPQGIITYDDLLFALKAKLGGGEEAP